MLKKIMFALLLCSVFLTIRLEGLSIHPKIRWGIISTAKINAAFIDGIYKSNHSILHAIASRDLQRAQSYAKTYNIPQAYGSYEDLLRDSDIDAIYISLPNALHAEWIIKAIRAGKHVMCEKPLVLKLEDLDLIEIEAKARNLIVFEALMYLHHPQMTKIKELIKEGKIGNLQHIRSWFCFSLGSVADNFRFNTDLGGGCLWDLGIYCTSLAIVLSHNELPIEIYATTSKGETGIDIMTTACMKFANGMIVHLAVSYTSPFHEGAHIVGSEGMITLKEPWKRRTQSGPSTILLSDKSGMQTEISIPAKNSFLCEIETMESCILDHAHPIVPLKLSKLFLKTILAIAQSAHQGTPIKLNT